MIMQRNTPHFGGKMSEGDFIAPNSASSVMKSWPILTETMIKAAKNVNGNLSHTHVEEIWEAMKNAGTQARSMKKEVENG